MLSCHLMPIARQPCSQVPIARQPCSQVPIARQPCPQVPTMSSTLFSCPPDSCSVGYLSALQSTCVLVDSVSSCRSNFSEKKNYYESFSSNALLGEGYSFTRVSVSGGPPTECYNHRATVYNKKVICLL